MGSEMCIRDSVCTGRRECTRTFFKVVLSVDSALSFRGGEDDQGQIRHARHDAGKPGPARCTARDRQLRSSAPYTSPHPPRFVDPSASHARAPFLILQPPTVCACSTLSQAQISRARPRAASAALRAATCQWTDFDAMAHVYQRGVARPRDLCGSIWSWHSDFRLYP